MMGRAGSKGMPKKNIKKINKKFICEYPLIAAKKSRFVKKIFVTTDCPIISKISKKYNAEIIKRPKKLATSSALGEDVYEHAYKLIKRIEKKIKYLVLLMANAPTINEKIIDRGINFLNKNLNFDSAVSVSEYNMWSPIRARKLNKKGELVPFVPFKNFMKNGIVNCDRDSQGSVLFADMSVSIVRAKCRENMKDGLLPQKWMGKKIAPIFSESGLDIDYEWQLPQAEFWIKKFLR